MVPVLGTRPGKLLANWKESLFFNGKISINYKWQCSIAMLNYQWTTQKTSQKTPQMPKKLEDLGKPEVFHKKYHPSTILETLSGIF